MSQFRLTKGEFLYLYGYDRPLGEFFLTKLDRETKEPEFAISSHASTCEHPDYPGQLDFTNGEILEILNAELGDDAPENFTLALTLDEPI